LPGAAFEELDRLNTTLEPDLQRMVAGTPEVRQLLRTVLDGREDPRDVLRRLLKQLSEDPQK